MSIQNPLVSWNFSGFLVCFVLFGTFPGNTLLAQEVSLHSIQIFTTHEWFSTKPIVYFQCIGENKTMLPDVTKKDVLYAFKGEESWQPLTELKGTKCKRCGFYEEDIMSSDVFDEWELCPSEFTVEGKYTHFKEKELNATLRCHGCSHESSGSKAESGSEREERKRIHPAIVVVIVGVVVGMFMVGVVLGYKHWQKKKRQQDQARFLKLFEDGDDIEDELGLGNTL